MQNSDKFIKYIIVFFLITVVIMISSSLGLLGSGKGFLGKAFSPMFSFVDSISQKIGGKNESNSCGNSDTDKKLKELTIEVASLRELEKENESLRKQLDFVHRSGFRTVSAEVVVKGSSSFLKSVTIDKGSSSGIVKNMAVISDGFLMGKIVSVTSDTSIVRLLTDSNFEISAIVQESNSLGLLKGQIGSGLIMDMIPQDKNLKENDTIVTSPIDDVIPSGIVIGKISAIDKTSQGLFQKASVIPFSNPEDARNIIVVLGN